MIRVVGCIGTVIVVVVIRGMQGLRLRKGMGVGSFLTMRRLGISLVVVPGDHSGRIELISAFIAAMTRVTTIEAKILVHAVLLFVG